MPVRLAVDGLGALGHPHARGLADLDESETVGGADGNAGLAAKVARRFGCLAYGDYQSLLDEQRPDAVVVAVPTIDHLAVAQAVIERGVHLLIEKPIAFTVAEGEQLIAAA